MSRLKEDEWPLAQQKWTLTTRHCQLNKMWSWGGSTSLAQWRSQRMRSRWHGIACEDWQGCTIRGHVIVDLAIGGCGFVDCFFRGYVIGGCVFSCCAVWGCQVVGPAFGRCTSGSSTTKPILANLSLTMQLLAFSVVLNIGIIAQENWQGQWWLRLWWGSLHDAVVIIMEEISKLGWVMKDKKHAFFM